METSTETTQRTEMQVAINRRQKQMKEQSWNRILTETCRRNSIDITKSMMTFSAEVEKAEHSPAIINEG